MSKDVIYQSKSALLEFLSANYQGPGAIVGYTRYTSATASTFAATGTTFIHVLNGSDKVSLTFTAPPSGIVQLTCAVFMNPGNDDYGLLALSDDGASWSTYTPPGDPTDTSSQLIYSDNTDLTYNAARWTLHSLSPGTSYTFYLGIAVYNAAHTFDIRWGGQYPSMILKAISLPSDSVLVNG